VSTANGGQRMVRQDTGAVKPSIKRGLGWLLRMSLLNWFLFVVQH